MNETEPAKIPVPPMTEKAIQQLIKCAHRELCRVEGSIMLAHEKLESPERLAGNARKQAVETVKTGPGQALVLEEALEALKGALRAGRRVGVVG
jgi:hypothetical protein